MVARRNYYIKLSTGYPICVNSEGQAIDYRVYFVEQLPLEQVDMRKMLRSADPNREGLNIITCGGQFDASRDTFGDRVLVYAVAAE